MIRRTCRGRSGVTLTEILISIMIMGIGIVSLATLFPLGLLRLRDAARSSRSGFLAESASADLEARNLLGKSSFLNSFTGPWYTLSTYTPIPYDPWVQDIPSYGNSPLSSPYGAYRGNAPAGSGLPYQAGPGLPVAYDPLWRATTGIYPINAASEARFASGLGFVRPDPNGGNYKDPSAHGLQRVTNFPPALAGLVADIFVSPEDVVLQADKDTQSGATNLSPVVPDMSLNVNASTNLPSPQYDWKYTWMFTGQQTDSTNGTMFDGEVVVFENRPFGLEAVGTSTVVPFTGGTTPSGVVTGETVVEAVFGYTANVTQTTKSVGYGGNASRTVLLRWSDKMPDPDVKVGSWIADVTYERNASADNLRSTVDPVNNGALIFFPYQRCYWYQVAKRTPAGPGVALSGDPSGGYRQMVVWTTAPLRAFTALSTSDGSPYHVNAALVSPYVVNVFSRSIYTR